MNNHSEIAKELALKIADNFMSFNSFKMKENIVARLSGVVESALDIAVSAEREECAKVAEETSHEMSDECAECGAIWSHEITAFFVAKTIRERNRQRKEDI